MSGFLYRIDYLLSQILIGLVRIYQITLSPDKGFFSRWLKGTICAHEPHCSAYSIQALQRYGFFKGVRLTMQRVVSCRPSRTVRYDPPFFRVVFFSSAPIGVPFLEQLARDNRFDLVGVVTAPDKPAGRGLAVQPNVIKQKARDVISTGTK